MQFGKICLASEVDVLIDCWSGDLSDRPVVGHYSINIIEKSFRLANLKWCSQRRYSSSEVKFAQYTILLEWNEVILDEFVYYEAALDDFFDGKIVGWRDEKERFFDSALSGGLCAVLRNIGHKRVGGPLAVNSVILLDSFEVESTFDVCSRLNALQVTEEDLVVDVAVMEQVGLC